VLAGCSHSDQFGPVEQPTHQVNISQRGQRGVTIIRV
jgi:hypothetical protein